MYRIFAFLSFLASVSSLTFNKKTPPTTSVIIRGPTAPLQNFAFFDQNVFAKGLQPAFLREAELKHGRIAMIASVVLLTIEQCTDGLAINQFQELPDITQLGIVGLMTMGEFSSMIRGWENPKDKLFRLKEDYQPGDFGFPLWNKNTTSMESQMDKELNNGRLAMIAVLGMIVQELVTGKQILSIL
jgi:Chlorophyll A-B binding protein